MSSPTSPSTLRAFLDILKDELGWQFNLNEFDDRLRLQKFVYLASAFGFEHPYSYGMHLRGPYSPPLAQDYYSDLSSIEPADDALRTFDVANFTELVESRDVRWLEVAATLRAYVIRLQRTGTGGNVIERAIEETMEEKDEPRRYVEQVYDDLRRAHAISD
ncbi:hypothetical protein HUG10_11610 [Halorarum halophilum]|uniref:Uncharacterized protein n=1 Tax=Halorarum halophilum TaxID=2743090 RepID=A0A7D5KMA5_9EURY|nr:hypothetical protein [Halobaculum halophilum]QLG28155.1 hypothetical protein HUG10_11610 [Halobaculum halophilum]